ncbi:hypothetical protein TSA6c_16945 [Azospirillum sp. TSA6c]|uniref:hypothetical protein n=1 Tax=Azospirillum sp. TSA6c TaxID=709813 RepID=UPI000D60E9BD|nr:hypothetical protein [Azospirillum sp. TSA6c]PWC48124.1 hypothetical protein TSA6c_16945 [Azospirillum sp. TSA6c]
MNAFANTDLTADALASDAMNNRAFFNTDPALESGIGIKVFIGDWGFKTKRAGGSNKAFSARMTIVRKPYERLLSAKPGPNDEALVIQQQEIMQKLLIRASAEKLLLPEWEGVTLADLHASLEDGSMPEGMTASDPAPFSIENAVLLFSRFPESFDEFFGEASKMGNFRRQLVQDQAGNSASA